MTASQAWPPLDGLVSVPGQSVPRHIPGRPFQAGGTDLAVATEADVALALAHSKSKAFAQASETDFAGALTAADLFTDDFSVDNLATNWTAFIGLIGAWSVSAGKLNFATGNGLIYYDPAARVDARVRVMVENDNGVCLVNPGADLALMLRNPSAFGGYALYSADSAGTFNLLTNPSYAGASASGMELELDGTTVYMRALNISGAVLGTQTYTLTGTEATAFAGQAVYGGVRGWTGGQGDNFEFQG